MRLMMNTKNHRTISRSEREVIAAESRREEADQRLESSTKETELKSLAKLRRKCDKPRPRSSLHRTTTWLDSASAEYCQTAGESPPGHKPTHRYRLLYHVRNS